MLSKTHNTHTCAHHGTHTPKKKLQCSTNHYKRYYKSDSSCSELLLFVFDLKTRVCSMTSKIFSVLSLIFLKSEKRSIGRIQPSDWVRLIFSQASPFHMSAIQEIIVGKGEITRKEQFFIFQQCFLPFFRNFQRFQSSLKLSSANSFSLEESIKFVGRKGLKLKLTIRPAVQTAKSVGKV